MTAHAARHYLDHASTTPLRPEAAAAVAAWAASGSTGDPARPYAEAATVRAAVEEAREEVAAFLGARPREVVFTASGTEAANWATRSARNGAGPGAPIVVAPVEHACVRRPAEASGPVALLEVDHHGRVQVDHLARLLRRGGTERPALVHCQLANHELGTLQPVAEVAEVCAASGVPLHVDACAAAGHVSLEATAGASLVSVSAHKLGGPPGIGALVLRRGTRLAPALLGSDQERGRRAGFENVPGILAFAAVARALARPGALEQEAARAARQRDVLLATTLGLPGAVRLGDSQACLPHLACVALDGVAGEGVVLGLDRAGVAVHSGSACSAEAFEPSPVIEAIGADPAGTLRVSVGWSTTEADLTAFAAALPKVVTSLRALAPPA